MATIERSTPLTAEQFAALPALDQPCELVRGRIVMMSPGGFRHGRVCVRAGVILSNHVDQHRLGYVVGNDSGVVTTRDPDSVRGVDVAFISYTRAGSGPLTPKFSEVAPELVVEVLPPSDRWPNVLEKVSEYLQAGVLLVVVLDPDRATAHWFEPDRAPREFAAGDRLTFPDWLGGLEAPVGAFFE